MVFDTCVEVSFVYVIFVNLRPKDMMMMMCVRLIYCLHYMKSIDWACRYGRKYKFRYIIKIICI